jgi:iron(III) transport system permease protein
MSRSLSVTITALVAVIVLAPAALVVYQSLLSGPFFLPQTRFSLEAFRLVTGDGEFWRAAFTSLQVATGMVLIAVPLGASLAFLVVRTDLPGRRLIEPLAMAPIFISPMVLGFGYVVTVGPVGLLSLPVSELIGFVPWTIYSKTSLILIAGLTHVPHVFLYIASALRQIGTDVEEAARSTGAGPFRVALNVSLPMVMPSLIFSAVLIFFFGFEVFGLALILGEPEGVTVLATYLYKLTNLMGPDSYQVMAVVVVFLFAITIPLVWLQRRLLKSADRYVSVKGKMTAQRPLQLGKWRWIALGVIALWFAITVAIPVIGLTLRSFMSSWGVGVNFFEVLTTRHFENLLNYPSLVRAMTNTLLIASVGGALTVAVYAIVSLAGHRQKSAWTKFLDYVILLPRAMPGLVAGLAIFWIFLFTPLLAPVRHTLISIWIAYTLVWLAYGMRLITSSLLQISPDLEEAGSVAGGSSLRVSKDITLPLLRGGLVACWALIFITFTREYSTAVYLLSSGNEVIGALLVSLWVTGAVDVSTALATVNLAFIGLGIMLMLILGTRKHG